MAHRRGAKLDLWLAAEVVDALPRVLEAIRPAAGNPFVRLSPAELIDESPTPLPLVGDHQVHHVQASFALVSVRLDVQEVRSIGREDRRDVVGSPAEPPGVLFRRHWCEAALRIVFALRGVWRRCDAEVGARASEQALHHVAVSAVATNEAVLADAPSICRP